MEYKHKAQGLWSSDPEIQDTGVGTLTKAPETQKSLLCCIPVSTSRSSCKSLRYIYVFLFLLTVLWERPRTLKSQTSKPEEYVKLNHNKITTAMPYTRRRYCSTCVNLAFKKKLLAKCLVNTVLGRVMEALRCERITDVSIQKHRHHMMSNGSIFKPLSTVLLLCLKMTKS